MIYLCHDCYKKRISKRAMSELAERRTAGYKTSDITLRMKELLLMKKQSVAGNMLIYFSSRYQISNFVSPTGFHLLTRNRFYNLYNPHSTVIHSLIFFSYSQDCITLPLPDVDSISFLRLPCQYYSSATGPIKFRLTSANLPLCGALQIH